MNQQAASAQKVAGPDPLLGRVIADRYRITSLIARGGMGKVYLAEQAPLGRRCAVKVLNPSYSGDADPEFHRRFFREASVTAKITHPNSVTIFDYGKTDDDIYFMVMEYLEGQTLHQALKTEGVMTELRVGRIAIQICRAVREAHRLGVIHRDLKPANIFLTRHGAIVAGPHGTLPPESEDEDFVKVLDFGLVKDLAERPEEQLTQTGLFMGSPKYMAPEQIQGGHVDERTDIYSLGIILYELLAGKVPFERPTSVSILMAHVAEEPPPMREINPDLQCTPGFEDLVMTCIAKDPNERFSSMDELLIAIRRVHGGSMTGQVVAVPHSGRPSASMSAPPLRRESASWSTPPGVSYASVPGNNGSWPPPRASGSQRILAPPARVGTKAGRGVTGTLEMKPAVLSAPPPPRRKKSSVATASPRAGGRAPSSKPPPPLAKDLGSERPRRSKGFLLLGALVAAVVGGTMGLLAFHFTAPPAPAHAAPPPPVAPAKTEAAPAEPAPAPPAAPATLKVSSEPAGASVREDGKELCPATPCEVTLKVTDAAAAHRIVVARPGYRPETKTVRSTDTALAVKLVKNH